MSTMHRNPIFLFRALDRTLKTLQTFAALGQPGNLAFCVGPGGAGKTSIASRIGEIVYGGPETWPPGAQPYVHLTANVSDRAYFSPKAFIASALKAVSDPFRARPEDVRTWAISDDAKRTVLIGLEGRSPRGQGERQLREAFVGIARLKQVRLLIIDEANLMTMTQVNRLPTDYLESVRLLGDEIGCPVILLGTTDMLQLLSYSAQINRRTIHIHLDRMRCEEVDDRAEFVSFLRHICSTSKFLEEKVVLPLAADIYEWTLGIPGEVTELFRRAQCHMAADDAAMVTAQHLRMSKHLPAQYEQMVQETRLIEQVFSGNTATEDRRPSPTKGKKSSRRMQPTRRYVGKATE